MGQSMHVVGFIPPDEKWNAMKQARDACQKAGIPIPKEISKFFGDMEPDPSGMDVEVKCSNWNDGNYREGRELKLSDIPPDVKVIRFYVSY